MKNAKKIDDFLASNEPRMGQGKRNKEVRSNITDNESAKMTTNSSCIAGIASIHGHNYTQRDDTVPKAFHGAGPGYCMVHSIEKLWKNTKIPQWT